MGKLENKLKKEGDNMLKLNETPIRTCKNFNINNIKIETFLPNKKQEFNNIDIKAENTILDTNVKDNKLAFGNGEILEENNKIIANHKLRIEEDKKGETIEIIYNFDDNNMSLINNIEVYAKNEINIIIKYISKTNKPCFHNGIIRTYGIENSKCNITIVNFMNLESNNFEAIQNDLENNANINYCIVDIGAKNSIINNYSNLHGKNAKYDIKTIYLGAKEQIKDINYIADIRGEKSIVNIYVQGALRDSSKKHFKGTIDFKKGCKKAKGDENEYCMLLSDKAKSIALPMLLCTEEDVEGNHSAASGKVDEKKLYYIMSRGIEYKEAVKLIVKANLNKIITGIKDESLKEEILNEIDKKLD